MPVVMTRRILVLPLLAGLSLASCGGGASDAGSTAASLVKNAALPATTTTARPSPTTLSSSRTTTAPAVAAPTTLPPVTVPATGPNTCAELGPCKVGQTGPAGGIVFYAAATPQSWGQYMEVNPTAFETITPDTCNLAAYSTYSSGKIGTGITQTAAVIAACAKDGKPTAAGSYGRVNTYRKNGYGGWFIPSKDELQALIDSKVITFAADKDLTSGTWVNKPTDSSSRGFEVLYGLKKEVIAGTAAYSRGGTVRNVEVMSDGTQSYGNPNNRWGWIYMARAFGPKA